MMYKHSLYASCRLGVLVCLAGTSVLGTAIAQVDLPETGGKLLLTRGISTFEGTGGGALTPWALITGNGTDRGVGASAHYTYVKVNDFDVQSFGAAVGLYDRFELSYSHQEFETGQAGAALGLGSGFNFGQDVYGAKLRLVGDAVYDQDKWLPQIALGVQYKNMDRPAVARLLGSGDDDGVDVYVSATKLWLDKSLLVNATLRYTEANQTGFLGFGGQNGGSVQPEFSLGYQLSKRLLIGGEYRFKPNELAFADEDDFFDIYVAYAVTKNLTITGAYADLGSIATFEDQNGFYLTAQIGF